MADNSITRIAVRFDSRLYVRSHGKQPRGSGSWAFGLGREPVFAPGYRTLTEAKNWLRAHVQTLPSMPRHLIVDVLP